MGGQQTKGAVRAYFDQGADAYLGAYTSCDGSARSAVGSRGTMVCVPVRPPRVLFRGNGRMSQAPRLHGSLFEHHGRESRGGPALGTEAHAHGVGRLALAVSPQNGWGL